LAISILPPSTRCSGLTGQLNVFEASDFAGGFVDVDGANGGWCGAGIELELELSLQLDAGSLKTC
jgi:hypothetical protein